ncbi:MAG: glycosyltransferase family 2 protein, partial [Acidimicrobiales bacterium]
PASHFEVVVVDDGSADEPPAFLRSWVVEASSELRPIRIDRNGGPGAARNVGWRAALAPIVASRMTTASLSPGGCRPVC